MWMGWKNLEQGVENDVDGTEKLRQGMKIEVDGMEKPGTRGGEWFEWDVET